MYRGKSIVELREELDNKQTTPEELFEKANKLAHYFQEDYNSFVTIIDKCKYKDCMHLKEDDCEIKRMVETEKILKSRYENYTKFIGEVKSIY